MLIHFSTFKGHSHFDFISPVHIPYKIQPLNYFHFTVERRITMVQINPKLQKLVFKVCIHMTFASHTFTVASPHIPGQACTPTNTLLTLSYIQGIQVPTNHKAWPNGYAHYCNAKLPVAKETCGRGRDPCCCYSSQFAPCQFSPLGKNEPRGGG